MLSVVALTAAFAQTGTAVLMTKSGALDGYEGIEREVSCPADPASAPHNDPGKSPTPLAALEVASDAVRYERVPSPWGGTMLLIRATRADDCSWNDASSALRAPSGIPEGTYLSGELMDALSRHWTPYGGSTTARVDTRRASRAAAAVGEVEIEGDESALDVLLLLGQAVKAKHPNVHVGWTTVYMPSLESTFCTLYIDDVPAELHPGSSPSGPQTAPSTDD